VYYLQTRLFRLLICRQNQQVLRLAILQEVNKSDFFVFWVFNSVSEQLEDMLAMVVANNTVRFRARHDQALLFKLISIAEADEAPLGEPEESQVTKLELQLESQVFLLINITIEVILGCRTLRLDQIFELISVLYGWDRRMRCLVHQLLRLASLFE